MDLVQRLSILHEQVYRQYGRKIDCYYMEGYGALFVPYGYNLNRNSIIFAFPDIAIKQKVV